MFARITPKAVAAMLPRARHAAAAVLVAAFCALPVAATEIVQRYDVYVSGLKIGGLGLNARVEGQRYSASGRVSGSGIIGAFFTFDFSGQSIGAVLQDGRLRPQQYSATQSDGKTTRSTVIRYVAGTPRDVQFTPDRSKRPNDILPSRQKGTLDPISATFALLTEAPAGEACGRSVDIYDGLRRSRLTVEPRRPAKDGLFVCEGVYTRVAGYSASDLAKRRTFPFTMTFRELSGVMQVVKFQTDTTFGRATAIRR